MSCQEKIDIAIIGAIHEEVNALVQRLPDCERFEHLHFVYFKGNLEQKKIAVIQSNLGKVNAALATSFIIERFSPQYIINIGSAGGFEEKLSIGDIVISSAVFYHDVDVTLLECAHGQFPDLPAKFQADGKLIETAEKAVQQATGLNFVKGTIATGDAFVSKAEQIDSIRLRFPGTTAVDMEAAAIAHTCYLHGTPFVVIRAISDMVGNEDNHIDFFTFLKQASIQSANTVQKLIALL